MAWTDPVGLGLPVLVMSASTTGFPGDRRLPPLPAGITPPPRAAAPAAAAMAGPAAAGPVVAHATAGGEAGEDPRSRSARAGRERRRSGSRAERNPMRFRRGEERGSDAPELEAEGNSKFWGRSGDEI
jgi:hypothetical protein